MSTSASEFDHVFRRHRREAVLLHRPYPPHEAPRTNSRFGGLPRLPAQYEWPRASDGTPLHFQAQIDCGDIPFATPLPDRGVLFFFGRDEAGYAWNLDDVPASDDCRVLYAPDASAATPPREAPADLPHLPDAHPRSIWPAVHPQVHVEWPIHPLPIASWPDPLPASPDSLSLSFYEHARNMASPEVWKQWKASLVRMLGSEPAESRKEVEERERRYKDQLNRLKADAYSHATGERNERRPSEGTLTWDTGSYIFFHAETGPKAYPQHWLTAAYCARTLLKRPTLGFGRHPEEQVASEAEDWLRRANEAGLDTAVPEEARTAFRAWLRTLQSARDEKRLGIGPAELVWVSMVTTIRTWAGDPSRSARLPPAVYAALRYFFSGFTGPGVEFSQMLGHAPSSQRARPLDGPVCLLYLGGYCVFWIEAQDLARRDFSKVWGTLELY
jgi:hypothetical protein